MWTCGQAGLQWSEPEASSGMIKAAIWMCAVYELSAGGWGQSMLGLGLNSGPVILGGNVLSNSGMVAGWLSPYPVSHEARCP